ncbi:COX15/CtaA family protein [Rapidithrix thailandica]|uniref:COX15/CtaA family protein n=1 Tax=Rapidithrix thailandica TaxID=413964 RepID=A0AAW9S245_9BACT
MQEDKKQHRNFRRFGMITVIAVYVLIMVGGIVRSTGSGLGCPDWPKCFGQWVPPTDESQLPENYQEIYAIQGKQIEVFNAAKTWTEYFNRLVGVIIGIFIFITLLLSFAYFKKDPPIFYLSLLSFLLVGFQGWLGSVVVSTNLHPVMITLHMALALVIVSLLIYVVARSYAKVVQIEKLVDTKGINRLLWLCLALSLAQIILGTQVREAVDIVASSLGYTQRETWIERLGMVFYVHRSFSFLVVISNVLLTYFIYKKSNGSGMIYRWSVGLMSILGLEILSGIILAYFSIPAFFQPVHLFFGTLIFGIQFLLIVMLNYYKFTPKASEMAGV